MKHSCQPFKSSSYLAIAWAVFAVALIGCGPEATNESPPLSEAPEPAPMVAPVMADDDQDDGMEEIDDEQSPVEPPPMVEVQPMPMPTEAPEEPMEKTMSVAEVCEAIVQLKGRLQTDVATGKVTTVWLNRTSARDDDMKMLRFLPDLTVLNITGTFISDSGLEHLHEVKSLRRIYLARTKATERGIAQLREAIPELRIMLLTSAP